MEMHAAADTVHVVMSAFTVDSGKTYWWLCNDWTQRLWQTRHECNKTFGTVAPLMSGLKRRASEGRTRGLGTASLHCDVFKCSQLVSRHSSKPIDRNGTR